MAATARKNYRMPGLCTNGSDINNIIDMNNDSLKFRVFKAIMALPVPVCIIIPSILLYVTNWQPGNFQLWRFLLGIVCFFAGISLAVSTVRLFPKLGNGTPAPWDSATKLIVTGPYAYVRNPMITGVVLILASEALMLSSLAIGIWAVVFLIINMFYFPLSEEPGLRKRFGKEYDEYCKNVPRYIPRLTPWKP